MEVRFSDRKPTEIDEIDDSAHSKSFPPQLTDDRIAPKGVIFFAVTLVRTTNTVVTRLKIDHCSCERNTSQLAILENFRRRTTASRRARSEFRNSPRSVSRKALRRSQPCTGIVPFWHRSLRRSCTGIWQCTPIRRSLVGRRGCSAM